MALPRVQHQPHVDEGVRSEVQRGDGGDASLGRPVREERDDGDDADVREPNLVLPASGEQLHGSRVDAGDEVVGDAARGAARGSRDAGDIHLVLLFRRARFRFHSLEL